MKKNSEEIFESVQVDPITGQYFIIIPEQIMNELSWYEDTEVKFLLDGKDVILSETIDWQLIYNDVWYLSNHLKLWQKDLQ